MLGPEDEILHAFLHLEQLERSTPVTINDTRQNLLHYFITERSTLEPLVSGFLKKKGSTYDDYLMFIGDNNTRPDEVALCALSRLYDVNVCVYLDSNDFWFSHENDNPGQCVFDFVYLGKTEFVKIRSVEIDEESAEKSDVTYDPSAVTAKCQKIKVPVQPFMVEQKKKGHRASSRLSSIVERLQQHVTKEPTAPTTRTEEMDTGYHLRSSARLIAGSDNASQKDCDPDPGTDDTEIYTPPPTPTRTTTLPEVIGTLTFKTVRVRRSHRINISYNCKRCTVICASTSALKKHVSEVHLTIKCPQCQVPLSTDSALRHHITRHHTDPTYFCPKCDSSFHYEADLKVHSITHKKGKKFVCTECRATFKRHFDLRRHMQTHSTNIFPCNFCEYTSNVKKYLLDHIKNEHGQPFICKCGTICKWSEQKCRHEKVCSKGFLKRQ